MICATGVYNLVQKTEYALSILCESPLNSDTYTVDVIISYV